MQSFVNTILDGLTFKDLAGKRQLRSYAVLTGLILFMISFLGSCVALERNAILEKVQGGPVGLPLSLDPAATEVRPTVVFETCPSRPEDWTFVEVLPGDNFQKIEETCVYDGLAKSVAWALAVRQGYTRAEATRVLGFAQAPMRPLNQVMTLTNTKGPLALAITFTPTHPDFAEWRVSATGDAAVSYGLRGCFRTSKIVGNQVRTWNGDFPVLCVLNEESNADLVITSLGGNIHTAMATPIRSFALFAYVGEGEWVWLGNQQQPIIDLAQLNGQVNDAKDVAELYGARLWDPAWFAEQLELPMRALPDGWQDARGDSSLQDILDDLNAYLLEEER
jgi:hypothetical protein